MAPFGGDPARGFDASPGRLAELARHFQAGTSRLEPVQRHASGDVVVFVAIERHRGEVGGLPEQDWSLPVTMVFRREGTGWLLGHRHADPLVNYVGLERAAAIARCDDAPQGPAPNVVASAPWRIRALPATRLNLPTRHALA